MSKDNSDAEDGAAQANQTKDAEIQELRRELSKLKHLDQTGQQSLDRARDSVARSSKRHTSSERAIVARQDALESQMAAMRALIEAQHKDMTNLLSPLTADISQRLEQSDARPLAVHDELKRESRDVRRRIREHEANLDCIAQRIDQGDEQYEECEDDEAGPDTGGSRVTQEVRRDRQHGDVTYDELAVKVKEIFPQIPILSQLNQHWLTLPVVVEGVYTFRYDEAPAAQQQPPDALGPVSRQLFTPGTQAWPPQSPLSAEPGAMTYVARAPSFDPSGGVVQVQVPGPQQPMDNSQSHTLPKPLLIDQSERERRESVRSKLIAATKEAEEEQLQKSCERIPNFPTCSDATELEGFLTSIVSEIRTVSKDPDLMCIWLREATNLADIKTDTAFQEWFDHLGVSGRGFVRTDVLLLKHVKSATKRAAHLHTRIGTKEQEFLRRGLNFRGRQAILMVREHFRESRTDREHTDRRRIDAVRLIGDNIEGYWDKFVLTLSELEPMNIPSESYLMDNVLTEMRKSNRFRSQITVWDQLLREDQRTFKQLEFMIVDFMKREQQLKTSQQIRNQTTLGSGGRGAAQTTIKKNSVCGTWKSKGYCNKGDDCQWLHPGNERGAGKWTKSVDSAKGGKGDGKGKPRGKSKDRSKSRSDTGGSRVGSRDSSLDSRGKPRSTQDPNLACKAWLKGNCKKSDKDCKFVHNGPCYWYKKNNSCKLGEKCLFLHGQGRAQAATEGDGSQPGGAAPEPTAPKATAKVKAKAKAKARRPKQTAMIQADDADS